MFEEAVREKFRFKLTNGYLTVEDLWDLSLEDLDRLARNLNKEVKDSEEESFIKKRTAANKLSEKKFELVKHIITVRLAELEESKLRKEKLVKKARIKEILEKKENEALEGKSTEELLKELETL